MIPLDSELWRRDSQLAWLGENEGGIRLLSVDLFDTLLLRGCGSPKDVYRLTGFRASAEGAVRPGLSDTDFRQIRIAAEMRARRGMALSGSGVEEVSLAEIYSEMPEGVGRSERLAALEQAVEREVVYLNPSVLSLIVHMNGRGVPVVIVSDTYFSRSFLLSLLDDAGLPGGLVNDIYSSADLGVRKSNGRLFERLRADFPDLPLSGMVHVGDHPMSDHRIPSRMGLHALRYGCSPEIEMMLQWEELRFGRLVPELRSLRLLASRMSGAFDGDQRLGFEIGAAVLGPVMAGFADWVARMCQREGWRLALGLMREGGIMVDMIQRAVEQRGGDLSTRRFFTSRQALFLGGGHKAGRELYRGIMGRQGLVVGDLLRMFGLDALAERFTEVLDVPLRETAKHPWGEERTLHDALIDALSEPEQMRLAQSVLDRQSTLFSTYLAEVVGDADGVVTVDIGYKGTMQKALGGALERHGVRRHAHMVLLGDTPSREVLASGLDFRGYVGNAGDGPGEDVVSVISKWPWVVELLFSAEEGTTLGYRRTDEGRVEPRLGENAMPDAQLAVRRACIAGVKAFQSLWIEFSRRRPEIFSRVREDVVGMGRMLQRLVEFPTTAEARLLGSLVLEFNHGAEGSRPLVGATDRRLLAKLGPDRFYDYVKGQDRGAEVPWPQGTLVDAHPGYLLHLYSRIGPARNHLAAMDSLVERLLDSKVRTVIAYGAGEVGLIFLRLARLYGLRVAAVVDRRDELLGTEIEGVPVMPLEAARKLSVEDYAVTSLAFADEIERTIVNSYDGDERKPRVFVAISMMRI